MAPASFAVEIPVTKRRHQSSSEEVSPPPVTAQATPAPTRGRSTAVPPSPSGRNVTSQTRSQQQSVPPMAARPFQALAQNPPTRSTARPTEGPRNAQAQRQTIETLRSYANDPEGQTRHQLKSQQQYPTAKQMDTMPLGSLIHFILCCEEEDPNQMSLALQVAYDMAKDIRTRREGPRTPFFPMQHAHSTGPAGNRLEPPVTTAAMRQQRETAERHHLHIQQQGPTWKDQHVPVEFTGQAAEDKIKFDSQEDLSMAWAIIRHLGRIGGLDVLNKGLTDEVVSSKKSLQQSALPVGVSLGDAQKMVNRGRNIVYRRRQDERMQDLRSAVTTARQRRMTARTAKRFRATFENYSPSAFLHNFARLDGPLKEAAFNLRIKWLRAGNQWQPAQANPDVKLEYGRAWEYAFFTHYYNKDAMGKKESQRLENSEMLLGIIQRIGSQDQFTELHTMLQTKHQDQQQQTPQNQSALISQASPALRHLWDLMWQERVNVANTFVRVVKARLFRADILRAYHAAATEDLRAQHEQTSRVNPVLGDATVHRLTANATASLEVTCPEHQSARVIQLLTQQGQSISNAKLWIKNTKARGNRWQQLFNAFGEGIALLLPASVSLNTLEKQLDQPQFQTLIKTLQLVHPWLPALGRRLAPITQKLYHGHSITREEPRMFQIWNEQQRDQVGYGMGMVALLATRTEHRQMLPPRGWNFSLHRRPDFQLGVAFDQDTTHEDDETGTMIDFDEVVSTEEDSEGLVDSESDSIVVGDDEPVEMSETDSLLDD